jgi:hypothetical protein
MRPRAVAHKTDDPVRRLALAEPLEEIVGMDDQGRMSSPTADFGGIATELAALTSCWRGAGSRN